MTLTIRPTPLPNVMGKMSGRELVLPPRFAGANGNVDAFNRQRLQRHHIRPENVRVVSGPGQTPIDLTEAEKRIYIDKCLEANEIASTHSKVGNTSGDYFGSAVELADGTWGLGTNIETSETDRSCGERISLLDAWNDSIKRQMPRNKDLNPAVEIDIQPDQARNGMRVKRIFMSKAQLGDHMVPCSECQGWMTSHRFFNPRTEIYTLEQDTKPGEYKLWIRTLQDLLPFWGKQQPSLTTQAISSLPMVNSESGQAALDRKKADRLLDDRVMQRMMQKAANAYRGNITTAFTKKRVGVAVLLSSGHIVSNGRFEWHKRMVEPADLRAAAYGIAKVKRWRDRLSYAWSASIGWLPKTMADRLSTGLQAIYTTLESNLPIFLFRWIKKLFPPEPTVQAIAYYGDIPQDIPSIKSLGYLAKKNHGGPDTLVLCIENDTLQVRSIQDYIADLYISATDRPKA